MQPMKNETIATVLQRRSRAGMARVLAVTSIVLLMVIALGVRSLRESANEPDQAVTLSRELVAKSSHASDAAWTTSAPPRAGAPSVDSTALQVVELRKPAIEPMMTAGHRQMLVALEEIEKHKGENAFSPYTPRDDFRKQVAALLPNDNYTKQFNACLQLGVFELQTGNEPEAIDAFTRVCLAAIERQSQEGEALAQFWLGMASLRLAETQNCCARNTPDSCLLPIRGSGIHTQRDGSTKAIECFTRVLEKTNPKSKEHMIARWLLNIAYMTLGEYPDNVPPAYLISPAAFESEESFPRFLNQSKKLKLNALNCAGGVIVDDFNNDGHLDVMTSNMYLGGQTRLWIHDGMGNYIERTEQSGLKGIKGGLNLVQADFNNDGHLDVLVLRGAWMGAQGRHPNSLLRNEGDGVFRDITFEAGLGDFHYPTQTAAWGDYDNDGDLDLYIGNEHGNSCVAPSQLFRNNGDETFTDVALAAGVTNDRFAKGVSWGDYDQDRLPDLYVSNLGQENRLYHNNGDGTFTDVAKTSNVARPLFSFPTWFWDYDNDGMLDLYVSAYQISVEHYVADLVGTKVPVETQRVYRGDGKGNFQDVSAELNVDKLSAPMGANFGDLDNDGFLDFYLGTGRPSYWELMPNVMYHSQAGQRFADVTTAGGFGSLQKGHGVAFADLDEDGDQEVVSQMGGAYPGDQYYNSVYANPGFGNNYLVVKLEGTKTNRSAIGARIEVEVEEKGTRRSVFRFINSGGSFGANPLQQSIGIGKASTIRALRIHWPTSNTTQSFENIPVNSRVRVVEGATEWSKADGA